MYFEHTELLSLPVARAAYSDRTAWLMSQMSMLAYSKFENNDTELKNAISKAGFVLIQHFNEKGTQAFLAKREHDKMAVLAFRGTEQDSPQDIIADLNAKFYTDEYNVKIHDGFLKAFQYVENKIKDNLKKVENHYLYITGHSLGGALALVATRVFDSDNLAACYTFGSPKVGNDEFDDEIKSPIYRIVNAYDPVPMVPPSYLVDLLCMIPNKKIKSILGKFKGYVHYGDMRYLTPCKNAEEAKVIANYNDFLRLIGLFVHRKEAIYHHEIKTYSEKLAIWALRRLRVN